MYNIVILYLYILWYHHNKSNYHPLPYIVVKVFVCFFMRKRDLFKGKFESVHLTRCFFLSWIKWYSSLSLHKFMVSSLNHLKFPEVGISFHSFMTGHKISSTWNVISFLLNLTNSHSSIKTQCTNSKTKIQCKLPLLGEASSDALPFRSGVAVPSEYIPLPFHFLSPQQ